jgi:hypothetical protein
VTALGCGCGARSRKEGLYGTWSPHELADDISSAPFTSHILFTTMAILDRFKAKPHSPASSMADPEKKPQILEIGMRQIFRPRIIAMAIIVSMGGFIFGMTRSTDYMEDCTNQPSQDMTLVRFQDSWKCQTSWRSFTMSRSPTAVWHSVTRGAV